MINPSSDRVNNKGTAHYQFIFKVYHRGHAYITFPIIPFNYNAVSQLKGTENNLFFEL